MMARRQCQMMRQNCYAKRSSECLKVEITPLVFSNYADSHMEGQPRLQNSKNNAITSQNQVGPNRGMISARRLQLHNT